MLQEIAEAVAKEIFLTIKNSGEKCRVVTDRLNSHESKVYLYLISEALQELCLSESPGPEILPINFGDARSTRRILKKWLAGDLTGLFDSLDLCLKRLGRPEVFVSGYHTGELKNRLHDELPERLMAIDLNKFEVFLTVSLGNYDSETDNYVALETVLPASGMVKILTVAQKLEARHGKPAQTWRDRPPLI